MMTSCHADVGTSRRRHRRQVLLHRLQRAILFNVDLRLIHRLAPPIIPIILIFKDTLSRWVSRAHRLLASIIMLNEFFIKALLVFSTTRLRYTNEFWGRRRLLCFLIFLEALGGFDHLVFGQRSVSLVILGSILPRLKIIYPCIRYIAKFVHRFEDPISIG